MNKTKRLVSADDSMWKALDKLGERYGMTGNALLAAAGCELARVKAENLWHALGRIAEGEAEGGAPLPAVSTRRIQGRRKKLTPALAHES